MLGASSFERWERERYNEVACEIRIALSESAHGER